MNATVFNLTMNSGFFCVVFHVCTAYLEYGSNLVVNSAKWKHGNWNDYFRSLSEGYGFNSLWIGNLALNVHKWTIGDYRRAIHMLLQPSALLRYEIKRVKERIGKPYTAIFVRRGDKIASREANFIPMSEILSYIPYTKETVFFIQTDDYTVIEEAKSLLPDHVIHCTVPPSKRGSYHSPKYKQSVAVPWTEKKPEDARAETLEMLVGLYVCLEAEHCWTDDTSNVGRFLKLYDDKVKIYPEDYSVDESYHGHPAWSIRA